MQGVDLLDDSARELLSRFRFIPDARLDDLMVSFATDGGGVGPHVDSYDVFLLQASGRRRWRISRQRGLRAAQGSPIKNVEGFRASSEWVLDAGDMLYLPPGVAHEGVALGECMTYSIGFRAPSYQQLIEPWFADYAEHANPPGRYADSGAKASANPAALPKQDDTTDPHRTVAPQTPSRGHRALPAALSERTESNNRFRCACKDFVACAVSTPRNRARTEARSQNSDAVFERSNRNQWRVERARAWCDGGTSSLG